jgi:hypothetical protein
MISEAFHAKNPQRRTRAESRRFGLHAYTSYASFRPEPFNASPPWQGRRLASFPVRWADDGLWWKPSPLPGGWRVMPRILAAAPIAAPIALLALAGLLRFTQ